MATKGHAQENRTISPNTNQTVIGGYLFDPVVSGTSKFMFLVDLLHIDFCLLIESTSYKFDLKSQSAAAACEVDGLTRELPQHVPAK